MFTSRFRPLRAWAVKLATPLVATCIAAGIAFTVTSVAFAATTTPNPVATTSSAALHSAVAARAAAEHALAKSEAQLKRCKRAHRRSCAGAHRAVEQAQARLTRDERQVQAIAARVARADQIAATPQPIGFATSSTVAGEQTNTPEASQLETVDTNPSTGNPAPPRRERTSTISEPTVPAPETETKAAEAPSTTTAVQTGVDSGSEPLDFAASTKLGAKLVRIEFPIGDTPAQLEPVIADYAERGIRVLPLAGFNASMPSPAQAQGLAKWASAFGPGGTFWAHRPEGDLAITDIEFGNETSYGYQYGDNAGEASYQERARNYAVRFKEGAQAITATGIHVGLLAQEDDWTGDWIHGMFEAVPNLGNYVAGWTIHPYGPKWKGALEDLLAQTAAHGAPSTIPVDITEWGLASDDGACLTENYGWNDCMSYEEASTVLTKTFSEMRQFLGARFGMFILYQVRDQQASGASNEREAYFGALQHELQPKGAFTTAAQAILAS